MGDLLQQGITAYKAGNRDEARKIFVSIVEQSPDNENAWKWMYNVCNTDRGRIHCLKQILRINPNNGKANELLKQFPTSKTKSKSGKLTGKAAIFIGVALVCLIGICAVSLIFTDNNLVTSNPSQEAPIPVEKAIEMTFSAAGAQTAASYSPTPLLTATLVPAVISQPTATVFIFEMQTQAQLVNPPLSVETNTPLRIYETNTPFNYAQPTLVTAPPLSDDDSGDGCCKHCGTTSKPCGDSCISNSYTCHTPPGCACY